jgi:hypothetical protein
MALYYRRHPPRDVVDMDADMIVRMDATKREEAVGDLLEGDVALSATVAARHWDQFTEGTAR